MPLTFKRGALAHRLEVQPILQSGAECTNHRRNATPADIAAVLAAHPEIAEGAGWVRKQMACKEAENAIRGYRLQNTLSLMDGQPLEIEDALTPPGERTVDLGKKELDSLVDAVCGAIVYAPTEGSKRYALDGSSDTRRCRACGKPFSDDDAQTEGDRPVHEDGHGRGD